MNALTAKEITDALNELKHWHLQAAIIRRQFVFRDLPGPASAAT